VCKTRAQGKESVVGAAGDVNAAMGTSLRRAHRSRDNRAEAVGGKDLTPIVRRSITIVEIAKVAQDGEPMKGEQQITHLFTKR
jgi:hypothetical protein